MSRTNSKINLKNNTSNSYSYVPIIIIIILVITLIILRYINIKKDSKNIRQNLTELRNSTLKKLNNLKNSSTKMFSNLTNNNNNNNNNNNHNNKNNNKNHNSNNTTPKRPELLENKLEYDDSGNQVFNLSENIYNYKEAKLACEALNTRLATFDELVYAYKKGANWCNYGWTDNQLALYPIQKNSYNNYQKNKNTKDVCGLPGINGGYFQNENMLFGVNCYGKKPIKQLTDLNKVKYYQNLFNRKYKYNPKDIKILPFSNAKWSMFN